MTTPSAAGPRGITFQPDIYPKVLSLIQPSARRVLDVGAGEGYLSQALRERGHDVEACDVQPELFKVAGVPCHYADLNEALPLPDGSFDCVVAVEVIEHVENHTRFVRELVRLTRPGGTIIISTPNVLSLPSRWHFLLYGYTDAAGPLDPARPDYYMQHINPISLPEILFLIERFGADLTELHTNRTRRSARWLVPPLYPLLALALRVKLLRRKHRPLRDLHRRHIRWMLHPANLTGRITIAVARRRAP